MSSFATLSDDVLRQIYDMISPQDVSMLTRTCSRLETTFPTYLHRIGCCNVAITEDKVLISPISEPEEWEWKSRDETPKWFQMGEVVERQLLKGRMIKEFIIKSTVLTPDRCRMLMTLLPHGVPRISVHKLFILYCKIPICRQQATRVLRRFIALITPTELFLEETKRDYIELDQILATCANTSKRVQIRYRGNIVVTVKQAWGFINNPLFVPNSGYLEWINPVYATDPSLRYGSIEYYQFVDKRKRDRRGVIDVDSAKHGLMMTYRRKLYSGKTAYARSFFIT